MVSPECWDSSGVGAGHLFGGRERFDVSPVWQGEEIAGGQWSGGKADGVGETPLGGGIGPGDQRGGQGGGTAACAALVVVEEERATVPEKPAQENSIVGEVKSQACTGGEVALDGEVELVVEAIGAVRLAGDRWAGERGRGKGERATPVVVGASVAREIGEGDFAVGASEENVGRRILGEFGTTCGGAGVGEDDEGGGVVGVEPVGGGGGGGAVGLCEGAAENGGKDSGGTGVFGETFYRDDTIIGDVALEEFFVVGEKSIGIGGCGIEGKLPGSGPRRLHATREAREDEQNGAW